jgi:hypothetical protein
MTLEGRIWDALDEPRTSKQIWETVNKRANPRISWEEVETALYYWLSTGLVRVSNKRFWRVSSSNSRLVQVR